MTETAIIEAVRGAGLGAQLQPAAEIAKTADTDAVARFEAAMAPAQGPTDIPFAAQISETWRTAQDNHQGILHRIKALTELRTGQGPSALELSMLQYEVANLSFQQEIVTNLAKKSSDAISTLVKNG